MEFGEVGPSHDDLVNDIAFDYYGTNQDKADLPQSSLQPGPFMLLLWLQLLLLLCLYTVALHSVVATAGAAAVTTGCSWLYNVALRCVEATDG